MIPIWRLEVVSKRQSLGLSFGNLLFTRIHALSKYVPVSFDICVTNGCHFTVLAEVRLRTNY